MVRAFSRRRSLATPGGRGATVAPLRAADWDEQKRVLAEALLLAPEARRAFVERSCAGRPELGAEVLSLLAAEERAGPFLVTAHDAPSLLTTLAEEALVGTQLGPYQLLKVLGRGGMGVVYHARRESPRRDVALKVLRLEADSASLLRRFAAESQILARCDHPYIARLLDAGATPDARPYFALELVEGRPLEEHCGATRLDLRARLALFLKVCEAVAYAHGRLVVHRDLKPSNILVSADGNPKLLDFGIARLLDGEPSGRLTETGQRLMTPDYASPEQVRGEPATVATDVHGLGLLLHVLLTGRPPFHLRSSSPEELVRRVCLEDLPAPSARCAQAGPAEGGFEPVEPAPRLVRLLRGDLDAIAARALRKEPERRYESVERLAADVRRYLDGRPVLARGGRWRYRAGKFARRHRAAVGLGAALVLALAGGFAATAWQARAARLERARAERRFADVRRLATGFLFEFEGAIRTLPGALRARELVVKKALEHLDSLAGEAAGDAGLQRELAAAYGKLAEVQGGIGMSNLGDRAAAQESLRKAIALLATARPEDGEGLALLGRLHHRLGDQLSRDRRFAEALVELERARDVAAQAAARLPAARGAEQHAHALYALSGARGESGDSRGEIALLREALALLDGLAPDDRRDPAVRARTARVLGGLSDALRESGAAGEALVTLERASGLRRELLAAVPRDTSLRRSVALDYRRTGRVLIELDRPVPAIDACEQSLARFRELAAEDPADAQMRFDVAQAQQCLCDARTRAGALAEARVACRAHQRAAEAAARGGSTPGRWDLGIALERMGNLERSSGRPERALAYYRRAEQLVRPVADGVSGRRALASLKLDQARALQDLRRVREAQAAAGAALALLDEALASAPDQLDVLGDLAEVHECLADLLAASAGRAGLDQVRHHYRVAADLLERLHDAGRLSPRREALHRRLQRADAPQPRAPGGSPERSR